MFRDFVKAIWYKRDTMTNSYNEEIEVWETAIPIEIQIYYNVGQTAIVNEVATTTYQIVGLTKNPVGARDKILFDDKTYMVNSVIPTRRLFQLFMEEDRKI